jgi:glycerol-3-phosphate acyltransferase PlsX
MTARIAVDAMGGDNAPQEIVAGALMAAGGLGVQLTLVGQVDAIRHELQGTTEIPGLRIVDAPDIIEMDESPTDAVRGKPNASINVGLQLMKKGEADAFVTAGNTGASMAAALLTVGRIRGIARPALATIFPTGEGVTILLDVGANADCRPIHLIQFAHLGSAYMQRMFAIQHPRVGLLSIGEEDTKGNELTIEVNHALRQGTDLNFIGNIEGKDLTRGVADVVVMDGFTGNVVVKTAEGIGEMMFTALREAVELTPWNRAAGLILMSELRKVKRRLDYTEYGGAVLLGVDGVTILGHGRSNARAVFSAIRAARDAVNNGVMDVMREVARQIPAKPGRAGATDADAED